MPPSGPEIAGLVLSATSFAIQLWQVGDQITEKFKAAADANVNDGTMLELSLAIIHESDQTNILSSILCDNGRFGLTGSIFQSMNENNKRMLLAILEQLWGIWTETNEVATTTFDRICGAMLPSQTTPSQLESAERNDLDPLRRSADVERLKRLLETATSWNRRLERRIQTYSWLHSLEGASPAQSIERLNNIAQDVHAQRLGWSKPAKLRQLVLGLAYPEIDRESLPIPKSLQLEEKLISSLGTLRDGLHSALMNREKILVEFLPYFKMHEGTSEEEMIKRVEEVVAFLNISKNATFRIPRARGFYNDRRHGRFGIVFNVAELNQSRQIEVVTLHKALDESKKPSKGEQTLKRPSLDNRFLLAHALALALSKFQSVDWVHQSIQSENIAFMAPTGQPSQLSYSDPWLFGYGSSRADESESVQLFDDSPIRNLYRHPDRWGPKPVARFNKLHDIYSLGVVLLEIAVWLLVDDLVKPSSKVRGASPKEVQDDLLSLSHHKKVVELMGDQFASIIEMCLKGTSLAFGVAASLDDKENSLLQWAFQGKVVDVLKKTVEALRVEAR